MAVALVAALVPHVGSRRNLLPASVVSVVGSQEVVSATADSDPVIAAAGDIACSPTSPSFKSGAGTATACRQGVTSDLLVGQGLAAVLPLGDEQYDSGSATEFTGSYDPSWGRVKAISRPVPGNHEYRTSGAAGYYGYFGSAAGDPSKGYYSYDIGSWHLVALNGNCTVVACDAGSAQEQWLKADLAANPNKCLLAYWHQPRFGTGYAPNASYQAFWNDLYDAGVDLVLNGHYHNYERFAPQSPGGSFDPAGPRQFIVGTGGERLEGSPVGTTPAANSQARNTDGYGVLSLTLHPAGYDATFLPAAGSTFTDSTSGGCHNVAPPPPVPSPPTDVTAVGGNGSASVFWNAPSSGGAPSTYTVTASPGGGTAIATAPTTTATVGGLTNGTSYTFTVEASNAGGSGPASSPSPAVTPSATGSGYSGTVMADSPSAYWRLGEVSGSVAADTSGNNRSGTVSGGVAFNVPGAVAGDANGAMGFDGLTGKVAVPDAAPLRLNGNFTVEFFAKMTAFANSWPGLMAKGSSSTANGWLVWYQADGRVWFKRNNQLWGTAAGAITSGSYRHFAVTYDGVLLRWFVDGTQVSASAASFPAIIGTDPLVIGQGDRPGNDVVDEVAVYASALTASRVRAHVIAATASQ